MQSSLKQYGQLLARYLSPQWPKVLLLAVLLFSSIGLQLVNPQILRYFVDTAISKGPPEALVNAALLFICVIVVAQVLQAVGTYLSEDVGWTATNALRADLASHCLRLDMTFHQRHTPGEMIERIDGDIAALSNFFSQFVIRILSNSLLMLGVLMVLLAEDWRVGLTSAVYVVVTAGALVYFQRIAVPYLRAARQALANLVGFWEERLSATEDIGANGAQDFVERQHFQLLRALLHRGRTGSVMQFGMWGVGEITFALGSAAVLAFAAYYFSAGVMTIGTVYLVFNYTSLLSASLSRLMEQMDDLQAALASIGRINELYHIQSRIQDGPGVRLPSGALAVEFQNVSFGYQGDGDVLRDISFRLKPGKTLGVLGRTGSGKTTLARLLFRFYDPDQGSVRLGDVDICELRSADLRRHIGMVTQDVQLFHASLRDNLTFFEQGVSDERILDVIGALELGRWYDALPRGLDTELMSGAHNLSAGEAQLVAFARVFLRDPGVVLLDEASSRLDPDTEQLIERAVTKLLQGRTGILIAHHLATLHRTDEIMILDEGRICEYGPREHLAALPDSRFYALLLAGGHQP